MKIAVQFICFCLYLLATNSVLCQSIQAVIVDKKSLEPIPDVFVFLDNSSIGTTSDTKGSFALQLPHNGNSLLVFSHLNYGLLNLEIEGNYPVPDTVFLERTTFQLEEAIVSETFDPAERKRRMRAFEKALLGRDFNNKRVKLKNPERLLFSEKGQLLIAEIKEPLIIENHILGYAVQLFLETFELAPDGKVFYQGKFFFDPMQGSARQQSRYQKQRSKRYQESSRKFFRDLVLHKLDPSTYELGYSQWNEQYAYMSDFKPIKLQDLPIREMEGQGYVIYPRGVLTVIDHNIVLKPDLKKPLPSQDDDNTALYRYKTQKFATSYFRARSGKIQVNQYGQILNPVEVEYYGYWASLRVAAMFPSDYSE